MNIFNHPHKHEMSDRAIIGSLLESNLSLIEVVTDLIKKRRKHQNVRLVFSTTINNFKITFMALQLTQGTFSLDQLALIDTDTNAPVQATFANIQPFTSDNPSVLTTTADPAGDASKCLNTALAAGTANVLGRADVTYTDSVSKQPVTKTLVLSIPYVVLAVTAGENVALTLIQGTPGITPIPPTTTL